MQGSSLAEAALGDGDLKRCWLHGKGVLRGRGLRKEGTEVENMGQAPRLHQGIKIQRVVVEDEVGLNHLSIRLRIWGVLYRQQLEA